MRLMRQKPTRMPYSCQVQFGMSGCIACPCGGEITMRAMGRAGSHSSSASTGQTINLSPSGSSNGLRASMAEYGRRSRGCMSTLFRFAQLYALRGPKRGHGGHDTLAKINFLIRAACMPDKELGSGERHQATRGGEHIVIRRAEPQDKALYSDFLRDVSAEDLRLRFFARVSERSAAESDRLSHLDYSHKMLFCALDEKISEMLGLV